MQNRKPLNHKNNASKQELFEGLGGRQCTRTDILNAANAINNLDEKYGVGAQIINGIRDDIKWGCAPEHIKDPVQKQNDLQVIHKKGLEFIAKNDFRNAIKEFNQALATSPNYHHSLIQIGICCLHLKDYARAAVDLERAKQLAANNYGIYYHLALTYLRSNQLAKASANITAALKLLPGNNAYLSVQKQINDLPVIHKKGLEFIAKNDFRNAIKEFNQALASSPNYHHSLIQRGICYLHLKDYAKAAVDLERAKQLAANNYGIYYHLALTYLRSNQLAKASANITAALKLLPGNNAYLSVQKQINDQLKPPTSSPVPNNILAVAKPKPVCEVTKKNKKPNNYDALKAQQENSNFFDERRRKHQEEERKRRHETTNLFYKQQNESFKRSQENHRKQMNAFKHNDNMPKKNKHTPIYNYLKYQERHGTPSGSGMFRRNNGEGLRINVNHSCGGSPATNPNYNSRHCVQNRQILNKYGVKY